MRLRNSDLPNRDLIAWVALSLTAGLALALLVPSQAGDWGRSGGPVLQAAATIGAILLLGSFLAVLAKRTGKSGKHGFRLHVAMASLGAGLVMAHGLANVGRPPALLLLLLAALVALGVWSRTGGARLSAGTFGNKRDGFLKPDPDRRARLAAVIDAKRALLSEIDKDADEATFSPVARHWRSKPFATLRYQKLAAEEEALTGARAAISPAQARWRLLHRLLAWAFVAGLFAHIVIVMLFAGYASDGGEIYWLHFADWDF